MASCAELHTKQTVPPNCDDNDGNDGNHGSGEAAT
jgi:hypothetical protein